MNVFLRNARARNGHVEATLNHPCPAQVQVAARALDRGGAAWGPFDLLRVDGVDDVQGSNVYFGAVNANPVDPSGSLLGLFPVVDAAGAASVSVAVTCDGRRFSRLERLVNGSSSNGRSTDHPVDGVVRRGDAVFFYVHRDVPGIARHSSDGASRRSRVVRLSVPVAALRRHTARAKADLKCG